MQARVRGEVHQGDPAQLRGEHKHGITKDIKLTNLILQLEYETKCRPVHKRICHATVGYGYVHGEKIQLGQASVNPLDLCLKWGDFSFPGMAA